MLTSFPLTPGGGTLYLTTMRYVVDEVKDTTKTFACKACESKNFVPGNKKAPDKVLFDVRCVELSYCLRESLMMLNTSFLSNSSSLRTPFV